MFFKVAFPIIYFQKYKPIIFSARLIGEIRDTTHRTPYLRMNRDAKFTLCVFHEEMWTFLDNTGTLDTEVSSGVEDIIPLSSDRESIRAHVNLFNERYYLGIAQACNGRFVRGFNFTADEWHVFRHYENQIGAIFGQGPPPPGPQGPVGPPGPPPQGPE